MCSTDTGPTMLNRFVRNREFSEVMTNHFWFDFNLIEGFAIVHTHNRADHFWDNDHITQMSLDNFRLFIGWRFLLCFAQLLDKCHRFPFQAMREAPTCSRMHQIHQLLTGKQLFIDKKFSLSYSTIFV